MWAAMLSHTCGIAGWICFLIVTVWLAGGTCIPMEYYSFWQWSWVGTPVESKWSCIYNRMHSAEEGLHGWLEWKTDPNNDSMVARSSHLHSYWRGSGWLEWTICAKLRKLTIPWFEVEQKYDDVPMMCIMCHDNNVIQFDWTFGCDWHTQSLS